MSVLSYTYSPTRTGGWTGQELASLWAQLLVFLIAVVDIGPSNAEQPVVVEGHAGVDTGEVAATGTDAPGGDPRDHAAATDGTAAVTL